VPLDVIAETIDLITSWEIVNYKYDTQREIIIEK
jgi:hypothetical protein